MTLGLPDEAAGGQELHATALSSDLFEAAAMRAVAKDLMAMKVVELKEELEARDEATSGSKSWLRPPPAAARRDCARVFRGSGGVRY
jgi:hypothetical protein